MDMQRNSKIFRRAGLLAVMAMLLQILVPLIHHPVLASNVNEGISHCGMQGGMPPVPAHTGKTPASKIPSCPICQSLHLLNGGFAPPNTVKLVTSDPVRQVYQLPLLSFVPRRILITGQARAPPVFA